jgi:hypothetical protein
MYDNCISECEVSEEIDQSQIFDNIPFTAINTSISGIIMTPTCDIAKGKTGYIVFCSVIPFENIFLKFLKDKTKNTPDNYKNDTISQGDKDKLYSRLLNLINNQIFQYHWIGEIPKLGGKWCVDYTLSTCCPIQQVRDSIEKRVAKILSPYKDSILSRYSAYVGRVALPEEDKEKQEYVKLLMEEAKRII